MLSGTLSAPRFSISSCIRQECCCSESCTDFFSERESERHYIWSNKSSRMQSGEILTRTAIWISILAYAFGSALFATTRRYDQWVRVAWTIGCVALLAHFAAAFNYYHAWSQGSAYSETARQTAEVFRINWGGGLFINYAVALFWMA